MKIKELFARDVTRDIPPVVYFHEQSPEKLGAEVSEYIITGGYEEKDPRGKLFDASGSGGIHEQFVRLLGAIAHELFTKKGGPELPASWISGFYGSGKSSFAKLLGLALDGVVLPGGTTLEKALLMRDDSPRRQELLDSWEALRTRVDPIAVVFDIGGVARDDEHIHSAVLRQVQRRLGYCSKSNLVAEFELRLQKSGQWPAFEGAARKVLKKEWSLAKEDELADEHFSHVLHVMDGERYRDPMSWFDSHAGSTAARRSSPSEVVQDIEDMLARNAEGKTLFIVVDEVSQYVHDDEGRMLKLQSFVSELGTRLKGGAWLLATGQQKLDDLSDSSNLGKLKARFPPSLRVHLANANIRDVVHKRLLRKDPKTEGALRELFKTHRNDLKLHAYRCEEISEEAFVEIYPMLPGQIDLLMQMTTNLRSSRARTDDHAIRGLLQLLGQLFREQKLADRDVGDLVTLDAIFDVQHSALDADVQSTLQRIFTHPEVQDDRVARRVAKAVALLELIQEQTPTTSELVAQCLYAKLGEGNQLGPITAALEKLRGLSLLSYSEKYGFKIQSSAGQEWDYDRSIIGVGVETISELVQSALKGLVGSMQERPKYKGQSFSWALFFSDGRQTDVRLADPREQLTFTVDFRFGDDKRSSAVWVQKSAQEPLDKRLVWVVGNADVTTVARELARSNKMASTNRQRFASLSKTKQGLVNDEEHRAQELEVALHKAVAAAFHEGTLYFQGQEIRARDLGAAFGTALMNATNRFFPELYPYAVDLPSVHDPEILQLLEPDLAGPSSKLLEGGLGILAIEDKKYVATCTGELPKRIAQEIARTGGLSGQSLVATFLAPPYGYPSDLVRACCAGLLRGKQLRITAEKGDELVSYRDADVREIFTKDRAFRKAEFFPPKEDPVSPRDRVAIGKLFDTLLGVKLDREDEKFADAVFKHFPRQREILRAIEKKYDELPGRPALPEPLVRLGVALEDCFKHRTMQKIVLALKKHVDALRDGLELAAVLSSDLTDDAVRAVRTAADVRDYQLAQLEEIGELAGVAAAAEGVRAHFTSDKPWRAIHTIDDALAQIRERYVELRRGLLVRQASLAEAAEGRVKICPGFEALTPEQVHRVLAPIHGALLTTTADSTAPALVALRDHFASRIGPAEEEALDRLDEERNRSTEKKVVKVEMHLRGREIDSPEQLAAVFRELEELVRPILARGDRVRLG